MRYKVIQQRRADGRYDDIASCTNGDDALLFAAALIAEVPIRGCVQVWAEHKGRHAFSLFCSHGPGPHASCDLMDARAGWRGNEKAWKAKQALERKATAARIAFYRRYENGALDHLREDEAFRAAFWVTGVLPDIPAAEARAAELGFQPLLDGSERKLAADFGKTLTAPAIAA